MKNAFFLLGIVATLLVAGCILSDELTTMVIRPDGSADWIRFSSNIRSSEKGEKGSSELVKLIEDFEARRGGDFDRIQQAGGEVLDARWIRREEPYSTLVTARFPSAATVERFWTIKSDAGEVLAQGRFTFRHNHRRLSLTIPGATDRKSEEKAPMSLREFRQQQANGLSQTRVIVADGEILSAEGFTVAADKRSCLLDPQRIDELLHSTNRDLELFVEWEIQSEQDK